MQGVETGLTLGPFSGLSLRGSYTYLDFDVAGPPGSPDTLLRRPHNRMQTTVRYRRERVLRGDDEIDINAAVDFVGRRKDLEPTTFATVDHGSYTIAGLGLTYARPLASVLVKRLALFVRVLNLSDENYDEVLGFKSPPVHFIAGTNLTF